MKTAGSGGGGGAGYGAPGNPAAGGAGGSGIVVVKELDKASGVWSLNDQIDQLIRINPINLLSVSNIN